MKFEEYYERVKPEIDSRLSEIFSLEDEVLKKILSHSVRGGKRFRPVLVVLSCDALKGDHKAAVDHAVVVELLHTASLVHDDIIDGDEIRRKMPTLWRHIFKLAGISNRLWVRLFGKPKFRDPISMAVLAGDGLLARAMLMLKSPEAFHAFADAVYCLLKGAVREATRPKEYVDRGFYYTTITLKTASLFATSTFLGAMCSDAPSYRKEALREFGKRLGILYQMVDDMCDRDAPTWLIENFEDEVREQYNLALKQLDFIPESEYKEALQDVVGFMLRKLAAEGGNEVRRIIKNII
jgi:geranylgeranyl pyrophosphate synthase